jgi:hypothetical protein
MTTYPWDDEIMKEVRERKAHVLEKFGGWDGLNRHIDAERPQREKEGWKYANVEDVRKQNIHRQMTECQIAG